MYMRFETSIHDYQQLVEPMLLKKEACNNLMLGILNRLQHDDFEKEKGYYLGVAEVYDTAVYAFMQTPPNNWILADVDTIDADTLQQVARFIYKSGVDISGVIGPPDKAKVFINELASLGDMETIVHMEQFIYQLNRVNPIPVTAGYLTEAARNDHQLVKNWLIQFGMEANEQISAEHADLLAQSFVDKRSIYLWKVDNKPVSMVNQSRRTKNGTTINAVFTPDEYKRNGYATAAVARLSEKLLQDGNKFCSLYTDAANPSSNSIYKKIGYDKVGSSIVYKLRPKKQ
ncbi:hypothetical protein SAMN04488072_104248 [Lentibacillus halodurans]|uniref:N-acetyltransferase domain-containing protein n=1 Tax=Lentibacillus halodurans TaxID=237679 RepID=A0A1I0XAR6_9BACI|nr:GNAT family N-acetyltransferase [Lentibacillus halodurans]SFA97378.1 hypothetical protein SAMN04488072_104248 [Lentibacillus halodurans]